jgi:hypothetical protein
MTEFFAVVGLAFVLFYISGVIGFTLLIVREYRTWQPRFRFTRRQLAITCLRMLVWPLMVVVEFSR